MGSRGWKEDVLQVGVGLGGREVSNTLGDMEKGDTVISNKKRNWVIKDSKNCQLHNMWSVVQNGKAGAWLVVKFIFSSQVYAVSTHSRQVAPS